MATAVLPAADILSDEKSCCLVCSVNSRKEEFSLSLQGKDRKKWRVYVMQIQKQVVFPFELTEQFVSVVKLLH